MKALSFISFFFLLTALYVNAQSTVNEDSLLILLERESVDSIKTDLLLKLCQRNLGKNSELSENFARRALELGTINGFYKRNCTAYSYLANLKYIRSQKDSANYFLDLAHKEALLAKDSLRAFNCLHNKAVLLHSSSKLEEALSQAKFNLKNFILLNDSVQIANSYVLIGSIYYDKGFNDIALENFYNGLDIHERRDNKYLIAEACSNIGVLLIKKNLDSAIAFLKRAISLYEEVGRGHNKAQTMNFLGLAYIDKGEYSAAKVEIQAAIDLSSELDYKSNIARAKESLAKIYMLENRNKEAIALLMESIAFWNQSKDGFNEIEGLMMLGNIYYEKQLFEIAEEYYEKVISLSERLSYNSVLESCYKKMAFIAKRKENYEQSTGFLEKQMELNDSMFHVEQNRQIEELNLIYEIEKKEVVLSMKESEIALLTQKVKIENLRKLLFGGGLTLSTLMMFFLVLGYRQKIKNGQIEQSSREKIYQQNLKFKEKELTTQTLHLVQKNEFIQKLSDQFERLQNDGNDMKKESAKIMTSLKLEPELDRDWSNFEQYFLSVHDNFDSKVSELSPNLSENEMRLIYLLRMKLNTNEIASILHIQPESIRKSKYRLKKKLKLNKEQDLNEYLYQL